MKLYENWLSIAYNDRGEALSNFWDGYMPKEQKIYEEIIGNKVTNITGTVKEISNKFNLEPVLLMGFLDGINDATGNTIDMEKITEDTIINIDIDFEKLYKKMVEYKAEHLYSLPEWNNIYTKEQLDTFYKEQKTSRTVVKATKIGRNDPCPCGSGKKYKQCCGK